MAKFEWKGLDGVIKKLESLAGNVANAIVKEGIGSALEPMKQAARAEAPLDTGATLIHVEITRPKLKKGWVFANVRVGAGDFEPGHFYPAYVVYGFTRNGILYPPNNFLKRAFDSTADDAQSRAAAVITSAVEAAWKSG